MLLKKGQKFQPTGMNSNSHNYRIGSTYEAIRDDTGNGTMGKDILTGWTGNTIMSPECKILPITRDAIVKELSDIEEQHKKEITQLQSKLAYLDETKKEEYDEMEYKCYQAIKSMGSNASDVEKAKLISQLIKGEF